MSADDPNRPVVLITDFLTDSRVEEAAVGGHARFETLGATREEDLFEKAPEAAALIVYHDIPRLTDRVFARAVNCRGIVRAGVGYDNLDVAAAARRGLTVCHVPDYGSEEVADHALALLIAVTRRIVETHEAIRAGGWPIDRMPGVPRLRGRRLGILGCGRIGTATALRAKALGLDVAFFDPFAPAGLEKALGVRRVDTAEALFESSPMISVHCYLDESTRHRVGRDLLGRMPEGGVLVNTARGGIVDQEALIEALENGRLAGAGLDVFEREPLDDERLRRHPKVVLTPHAAFYSVEGFEELRSKAAEEALRLIEGRLPRCPVPLPRGDG